MPITRRTLLRTPLAVAAAAPAARASADAAYPSRPVTLVVGFAPGSSTDVASRIVADRIGTELGPRMVVENKPGAASRLAADFVARARPDGYTLFVGTVANVINDILNPGPVAFARDLVPVALFATTPLILAVPASLPVANVAGLVALARAKPDSVTFGSPGLGTAPHLAGESFGELAGVRLTHVPYSGSAQAVTDLMAGRLTMMFVPASSALGQVRAGTLRGLATTTRERTPVAPDLPSVAEAGLPGFESSIWFGIVAPPGTPGGIVERLAAGTGAAVASAPVRSAFAAQMVDPLSGGPAAFRDWIDAESRRWQGVIARAGLGRT